MQFKINVRQGRACLLARQAKLADTGKNRTFFGDRLLKLS